jgi:bifunctional DNA-binding transcriptional regulator/antitoxin component of YhaV-PrlF toxin-antitoxin module
VTTPIEIKKIDSQGRIVLPLDWRESDLKDTNEVFIIREKGYLKIVPKHKIDLTQFFDKADFGDEVELSSDWDQLQKDLVKSKVKKDLKI